MAEGKTGVFFLYGNQERNYLCSNGVNESHESTLSGGEGKQNEVGKGHCNAAKAGSTH